MAGYREVMIVKSVVYGDATVVNVKCSHMPDKAIAVQYDTLQFRISRSKLRRILGKSFWSISVRFTFADLLTNT